jgi:hypothetical protein
VSFKKSIPEGGLGIMSATLHEIEMQYHSGGKIKLGKRWQQGCPA